MHGFQPIASMSESEKTGDESETAENVEDIWLPLQEVGELSQAGEFRLLINARQMLKQN